MVKKHIKKAGHHYKKTFTRTDGEHEPEDHHIASVIFLLGVIIVLLCGVIYFLLQEDKTNEQLIQDLLFSNPNANDYSYYKYSLEEFERVAKRQIVTLDDMQSYLMSEQFEDIRIEEGIIEGKKGGGCYEDKYRAGTVCRTLIISYEPGEDEFIEMTVVRQLLEE